MANDVQVPNAFLLAARNALLIQDAVNLSGIVKAMAHDMDAIWDEARKQGKGTDWVNQHPIVTTYLDKLRSLNGWKDSNETGTDYCTVRELVKEAQLLD